MNVRILLLVCLIVLGFRSHAANFIPSGVSARFPEKRIAMVVGNSNYLYLSPLRNSLKDAEDISAKLGELGFDVLLVTECSDTDLKSALNQFADRARDYDIALFYYAGHGFAHENQNYLIPVTTNLEYRSSLRECLNADDVLERMDNSGVPARIVILDACRSNKNSWTRDTQAGLVRMEGAPGSVIIFSTQTGNVAQDGEGENSPFAIALMDNISVPGADFAQVTKGIVQDTYAATDSKQYPLVVGTLIGDFVFNPAGDQIKATVPTPNPQPAPTPIPEPAPEPTPLPEPAPEPINNHQQEPKIVWNVDNIDLRVLSCVQKSTNITLTLLLANNTGKTIDNICVLGQEPCNGNRTAANINGDEIPYANMTFEVAGKKFMAGQGARFTLPDGLPTVMKIRIKDCPDDTDIVALFTMALRNINPSEPYGIAYLKITKIPVGYASAAPAPAVVPSKASIKMSADDIDITTGPIHRNGSNIDIPLTLTNNSADDLRVSIIAHEPCTDQRTMAYTQTCETVDWEKMEFLRGGQPIHPDNITLASEVPVKLVLRLRDIPETTRSVIPYLRLHFRGADPAEPYGIAQAEFRNLKIE